MERLTITSSSPVQTRALGVALGRAAEEGDVLLLEGPFGAGKTVLVQGLAAGLGVEEYVSSPSFVMINEHRGRLTLYHIDLYRIDGRLDPETLDALEEYMAGDGICAIEWPALIPTELTHGATLLRFRPRGDSVREIDVETPTARLAAAIRPLSAER